MRYSIEYKDNCVIFTLRNPDLDSSISAKLKAELLIICQSDISALIVDLSHVDYIDSSGMGALLLARRQLKEYDIPVILLGIKGFVKEMLKISRIYNLFEIYDSNEEIELFYNYDNMLELQAV